VPLFSNGSCHIEIPPHTPTICQNALKRFFDQFSNCWVGPAGYVLVVLGLSVTLVKFSGAPTLSTQDIRVDFGMCQSSVVVLKIILSSTS